MKTQEPAIKTLKKKTYAKNVGVLDGEVISVRAFEKPTTKRISVQAKEFLKFCEGIREGVV